MENDEYIDLTEEDEEEISPLSPRSLPLKNNKFETEEMTRIQNEYKQYWREHYGYPEKMPEFARRQRQKYLEQKWTDEERLKRLQELRKKSIQRKVEKLPSIIREKFLKKCDNLTEEEAFMLDPNVKIRLRVKSRSSDQPVNKCYDVTVLYHAANTRNKDKKGNEIWVDPEEGTTYSVEQVKRIKRIYDRVAPEKPSAILYQQEQAIQKQEAEDTKKLEEAESPKKEKENVLFGCKNLSDEQVWKLKNSNRIIYIDEDHSRYCYDLIEFIENHVLINDGLWTNPATGKLIPRSQQHELWIQYQNIIN